MKHTERNLLLSATCALLLLAGCKGRTTDTVEPDGTAPVEVTVMETNSAAEAADTLRRKVKDVAPKKKEPRKPAGASSATGADATETADSADNPFMQYNLK